LLHGWQDVDGKEPDHGTLHKPSVLEDRMAGRGMDRRADLFLPFFYMVMTSFKTDADAVNPPCSFTPTLENYANMTDNYDYWRFATNSMIT
jgi:hypothetical protein